MQPFLSAASTLVSAAFFSSVLGGWQAVASELRKRQKDLFCTLLFVLVSPCENLEKWLFLLSTQLRLSSCNGEADLGCLVSLVPSGRAGCVFIPLHFSLPAILQKNWRSAIYHSTWGVIWNVVIYILQLPWHSGKWYFSFKLYWRCKNSSPSFVSDRPEHILDF